MQPNTGKVWRAPHVRFDPRDYVTEQVFFASKDGTKVPTVLLLKPDQRRYWTRSQALRDADELAVTIQAAGAARRGKA